MRAYVLSIGSELIGGHLTDTNATFLAQELAAQGIELLHVIQVGDDLNRLVRVMSLAIEDADLVICTGGVGPTDDDLTREAIAALTDETPIVDESVVANIREFFAQRGLEMPERNAKQAWIIPSAEILPNPVGTAPGWFVRIDDSIVVAMPGVPREMFRMWAEQVVPRLSTGTGTGELVFRSANLRTLGIGESAVSELLGNLTRQTEPYVGTYAKDDGVHVRVTAAANDAEQAEAMLRETVSEIGRRLRAYIYADDDRSLPQVLLDSLAAQDLTIAVSEAGSGGRFASLLMSEPSSNSIVMGGEIGGAEAATEDALSVAQRVATRFGASIGLHVGIDISPTAQGLYEGQITVGVADSQGHGTTEVFPIRAAYAEIQRRSAMNAADVLRRFIASVASASAN
jgi:nicotinamide-nucleotide amidase